MKTTITKTIIFSGEEFEAILRNYIADSGLLTGNKIDLHIILSSDGTRVDQLKATSISKARKTL